MPRFKSVPTLYKISIQFLLTYTEGLSSLRKSKCRSIAGSSANHIASGICAGCLGIAPDEQPITLPKRMCDDILSFSEQLDEFQLYLFLHPGTTEVDLSNFRVGKLKPEVLANFLIKRLPEVKTLKLTPKWGEVICTCKMRSNCVLCTTLLNHYQSVLEDLEVKHANTNILNTIAKFNVNLKTLRLSGEAHDLPTALKRICGLELDFPGCVELRELNLRGCLQYQSYDDQIVLERLSKVLVTKLRNLTSLFYAYIDFPKKFPMSFPNMKVLFLYGNSFSNLETYFPNLESLYISMDGPLNLNGINFNGLNKLKEFTVLDRNTQTEDSLFGFSELIFDIGHQLTSLKLNCIATYDLPSIIASCPNLEILDISGLCFSNSGQTSQKISLNLKLRELSIQRLHVLSYIRVTLSRHDQIILAKIIESSPDLTVLILQEINVDIFAKDLLKNAISKHGFPMLEELYYSTRSDICLVTPNTILELLLLDNPLKRIELSGLDFDDTEMQLMKNYVKNNNIAVKLKMTARF